MEDLDTELLTADERARLDQMRSSQQRHRDHWLTYLLLFVWGSSLAACVVVLDRVDTYDGSPAETAAMSAMVTVLVACVPVVWIGNRLAVRAKERRIAHYLKTLSLDERRRPTRPRSGDEEVRRYWATGSYDPARYHQATSGWSKAYRDYVKDSYGDLDTHESNSPG